MIARLAKFVRRLSPTCREAARLISDAAERDLPRLDRIGLKLHLWICRACRSYRRSVEFLREALRAAARSDAPIADAGLPPDAKQRLLAKLQDN